MYDGAEDEIISPDVKTTKTKLSMKEKDLAKIENDVREIIRRTSSVKPVNV